MKMRQLLYNLFIGFLVVAAFLPIYSLSKEIQRKTRRNMLTSAVTDKSSLPARPAPKSTTIRVDTSVGDQALETLEKITKKRTNKVNQKKSQNSSIFDDKDDEKIELHFENADFQNLINQIALIFDRTFIPDDSVQPLTQGGKALKGNKISFKTHKPLSRKDVWNLFTVFLDIGGFALVPQADPKTYRITSVNKAKKSSLPSFIGVDPESLPETDELIRYLYFVENSNITTIKSILDSLRSPSSALVILPEIKAFVLTDKAYGIKTLMKVVKELDKVTMPQSMSVLKLKRVDAEHVKKLYESLTQQDKQGVTSRLFPQRKQPTSLYFPENTRIIAEPRTNALILLGPQNAIKKIEDFVTKYVDIDPDKPYSPLHIYQLRYADTQTIANIMNNVTQFGKNTQAGKSGGVRGEDKYIKSITFTAEKETNQLIIRGDYEDYLKAVDIIAKLDEPQPQVAIEILILSVQMIDNKEIGAQIRNKKPGPEGFIGSNVNFQTSGLRAGSSAKGILENSSATIGAQRLLADLVSLVNGAPAGNTIISLGNDAFGVWGIFQMLRTITSLQVVSNPFLIATNKTPATVSLGEVRRVVTGTVVGTSNQDSFDNEEAVLDVKITPQINSDGMILLKIHIKIDEFINATDPSSANKTTREIKTQTIVADKEVLALGGLIENKVTNELSKTPILGNIPVLGWLFKNKRKSQNKNNLLVLLSTRIIEPEKEAALGEFTNDRIDGYRRDIGKMEDPAETKDPIYRMFFKAKEGMGDTELAIDNLIFQRHDTAKKRKKKVVKKKNTRKTRLARRKERKRKRLQKESNMPVQTPTNTQESVVLAQNKIVTKEPTAEKKKQIVQAKPPPKQPTTTIKHKKSSITGMLAQSDGKVSA